MYDPSGCWATEPTSSGSRKYPQPSASREPRLPHAGHPNHCPLTGRFSGLSIFVHRLWPYALALFVLGWILQFIGHAFEGKPPEFFSDWRFLFVGVRWWWAARSRAKPEKWLVGSATSVRGSCLRLLATLFYAAPHRGSCSY